MNAVGDLLVQGADFNPETKLIFDPPLPEGPGFGMKVGGGPPSCSFYGADGVLKVSSSGTVMTLFLWPSRPFSFLSSFAVALFPLS